MLYRPSLKAAQARRGAAVVEVAIVLPLLVFLFLVAVDFCRVFHFSQVVTQCARNGALYESDPYSPWRQLYTDVQTAATADAPASIRSSLTVTSESGSDTYG